VFNKLREFYKNMGLKKFKDRRIICGVILLFIFLIAAIFAPYLAPHDPYKANILYRLKTPTMEYPFGTDEIGRCILSRIMYGGRYSISMGFIAVIIGILAGVFLGILAGFYTFLDNLIMRFLDLFMAIPSLILAVAVVAVLGPGPINLVISVGITSIPRFARLTRSYVISLREMEFVDAAKTIGCGDLRIMFRHILPNCVTPIIVYATLLLGEAILQIAQLNFLGLGIRPPLAEWGSMASVARRYLNEAPLVSTIPCVAIMLVVLAFNLLGDAMRDIFDPKL